MPSSSSRNATRRLLKELEVWNTTERKDEKGIERLGPIRDDELLTWEAVINGRGIGAGYDGENSLMGLISSLKACVH
jgi:peroxin-4